MNAREYCANCHAFPDPSLLTKEQWAKHVLPKMAEFMHVDTSSVSNTQSGFSREIWKSITAYYEKNAPEVLPIPALPTIDTLKRFQVLIPPGRYGIPSLTMLRKKADGGFCLADANTKSWLELRADYSISKAGEITEGGVDMLQWKDHSYSLFMGSFSPTEEALGLLLKHPLGAIERASVIADSLQRPVCMRAHDWNKDGAPDFVICEFGKYAGGLSLYLSQPDGKLKRSVLQSSPGAVSAELRDFNKDGLMDIVVLFAQANERIDLMLSDGKGGFKIINLMQFPASYGSSSLKLYDLDADGMEEFIYTAGDNADFPAIIKPYHGIYIYKMVPGYKLKRTAFYPLPGAYAAHPGDFDGDGKPELACISFFPDWEKHPELSFVIIDLDQSKKPTYSYIPDLFKAGRWIVMESTDIEGDGDLDILLGSMTMETSPATPLTALWAKNKIPFVVLRNLNK